MPSWFGNLPRLRYRSGAGDDQSEMSAGTTPPCRGSSADVNENVRRRVFLCTLFGKNSWASCALAKTLFDAELGPNDADLGLLIQARVPLHMHQQLDDVFDPWFYFWKEEHWIAAQRRNNRRDKHDNQQYREEPSSNSGGEELPPHVVNRLFSVCIVATTGFD